jgi:hypothetical protein
MASAAILFNPVIPVGMARVDWRVLDLIGAVLFVLSLHGIRVRRAARLHRQTVYGILA